MTLPELIAALEAATEPSRELDAEIAIAVRLAPEGPGWWRSKPTWTWKHASHGPNVEPWAAPNYTASLDAALTLVPGGLFWGVSAGKLTPREPLYGASILAPKDNALGDVLGEGESSASAAIALCIAALRARLT